MDHHAYRQKKQKTELTLQQENTKTSKAPAESGRRPEGGARESLYDEHAEIKPSASYRKPQLTTTTTESKGK